ncbi:helix-turn-helix domain-containing protein [Novosphingobium malaysiense]|uniref:helix-turn-helix domain-containing protein n=1 Tax=Novosphingobium malaysiense TaxID=1348853 RepID=UPI00068D7F74|nr:helix-turn-helix domain-containing protein [Novosphingobium malaysiense]
MSKSRTPSANVKYAARVLEVLDYFDERHLEATVMEIARHYDRPITSTAELLNTMLEMGLVRRAPGTRAYALTPRAAFLGTIDQPSFLRDGSIVQLMDRLAAQTRFTVLLLSRVGVDAQIVALKRGTRSIEPATVFARGAKGPLFESIAGKLLLSTLQSQHCKDIVRRLNAEASEADKFNFTAMMNDIKELRGKFGVFGPAGFCPGGEGVFSLLPPRPEADPIVIGILCGAEGNVDSSNLLICLNDSIQSCLCGLAYQEAGETFFDAA